MMSLYLAAATCLIAALVFSAFLRCLRASSIAHLPGPPPGSWLVGNLPQLIRPKEIGDADFAWTKDFGSAVCIKGTFGRDKLFTTDPKAFQYILNTATYSFPKPPELRAHLSLVTGKGIIWAEGIQHSRQRTIMSPAFSYSSLRGYLPVFHHTAQQTVTKLIEHVQQSGKTSAVIDTPSWLARMTLDAIGIAAFDYQFGALDEGNDNKLFRAYANLFADAFWNRSDLSIAFESAWGLIPQWLVALAHRIPVQTLQRLRNYMKASREVAQMLLDRQMELLAKGIEGSKDIMSILIRANITEDSKAKLEQDEILAQLTTIFLAGHETTAGTLGWVLYELSRRPECQRKVREEIKATRKEAAQRGDGELTMADFDSMSYLLAVLKETLRYYPILHDLERSAGRDDIIPLETPQKTKTNEYITSIPVSKGQHIILSIAAYNRLPSIWGDDADKWRPERFTEEVHADPKTSLGVIANIATFSSGTRSCIGWKFALIEMQAMLIELVEKLEFSPPPRDIEIIRGATTIMIPMIKGSNSGRTELPLTVAPISDW